MSDTGAGTFHPLIAKWFGDRFGNPTDVQVRSWKAIQSGVHTLIAAPTGSGKTLASLLPCLSWILQDKELEDETASTPGVKLLYITPLKALNNDIHHHVIEYIAELKQLAEEQGSSWRGLSIGVRTGDTSQSTRASMLRNPPDVLVTTPESLYLLLTSPKGRMMLKTVLFCVVDEIHDLAADSRGLHLSVTLERLTDWIGVTPQRIGVSATQKPIERIATYLGGWDGDTARAVEIIESRMEKKFSLRVTLPEQAIITKDKQEAIWKPLTDHIMKLIEDSRSALIFVNNRRLCERLTLRLNDHVGYEMARSHHGSISREQRLEVEGALKAGKLRCLVATSSLELGIDVGHIDLVLQIDSPKSAAAGIQRIGRAGHSVGDESRGVIVARTRGQLPECAVLARNIEAREIEAIHIPRYALDVLCQQIVAMVAADDRTVEQLQQALNRSYGYHGFPLERLEAVLQVLSGYYPFVRPLVDWDRTTHLVTRRSSTAMTAIMGAGTIPQGSAYPVHHAESRIHLGELDEEYIHESRVGDVFQLGTGSWRIQSIRNDRVYVVEESGNTFSEIPFWRGEGQGRAVAFSTEIGCFLEYAEERLEKEQKSQTIQWLMDSHFMEAHAADELLMLIHSQKAVSELPTHRRIVIEQFQDDFKQHHLIIHSWFGRAFNRTWQLAIQLHAERSLPYRIYANAKDNGIEFIIPDGGNGEALKLLPLIREVTSERLEELLRQAVPSSPQFGIAFRRLAETSLLLSRSFNRMPTWQKRLRSEELLRESLPYAEQFPFIGEAIRLCLHEELDVEGVRAALIQIETGKLEVIVKHAAFPSPFAVLFLADFINAQMYESDAVGRDVQTRLMGIDRSLAGQWFGDVPAQEAADGAVSNADEQLEAEGLAAEPAVHHAEQLISLLKRRGERTEAELSEMIADGRMEEFLDSLKREKRLCPIYMGGGLSSYWICADEADTYALIGKAPLADRFILTRYIDRQVSFTAEQLNQRYGLDGQRIEELLHEWEAEGRIEAAPLTMNNTVLPADSEAMSHSDGKVVRVWLNRQANARQTRTKAHALRQAAESVNPVSYCTRMMALQHVLPHMRLSGEEGLREVIAKLQGFFCPLSQWETSIFPLRMTDYRKEMLDQLCAGGEVLWIGQKQEEEKEGRIAFFLSESKELYAPFLEQGYELNPPQTADGEEGEPLLELLTRKGASFLSALSRETGDIPSELTADLLALSWRGLVSNDQFAPLRLNGAAKSAKPSKGKGFQSGLGRWYALSSLKEEHNPQAALSAWIKHLLGGYGLLTKELAAQHLPWSWDEVYAALKQLENWGMLTRGLWVKDVKTLQFSIKDQVENLRTRQWDGDLRPIVLPSTDPANPFGLIVKWPDTEGMSFARKKGNDLVIQRGRWLLWIENGGKRIYTMYDQVEGEERSEITPNQLAPNKDELYELLRLVAAAYLKVPNTRKLVVDKWNDIPILQSEAAEILRKLGAEADRNSLVIWPSALR
ncbi:DEAD/DEAH box helicase [Paenibacillus sp. LMG 31456]|uniref:DEAD/DEAH box helicase n=1 Tax=Paenibacillus foliorum TaxID=2654974 RepID=A0A972H0P6_9BACL|nr:DEAD/DEAH box helicase [Paenibacillus foliorum]NOU97292.1 DEAD/DEAH box helicase [Paenibacillus foliorum]